MSDPDGYTSAAIMYQYIKLIDKNIEITYSIHNGKEHGLSKDIKIPSNINLLIIPDAGSNDYEQLENLHNKGIDIIVLDHHLVEKESEHAIIVNNQISKYPNKNLSGVGVVYRFLQALDDETWNNYADNFLDLVALGNIADVMDTRELETRYYINKGLSQINNKMFKALIDKQYYSIRDEINITNIAFYIVPLINAMIRFGTMEQKTLLFEGFIEHDMEFDYKPRGKKETIKETIYEKVARECVNAKSRQGRSRDKAVEEIKEIINKQQLYNDKIIILNVNDILDKNLTGLVAMQIANYYQRPCLLLRPKKDNEEVLSGSARNYDKFIVKDLRSFINELDIFDYVQGHENAFGVQIKKDYINSTIEKINNQLKDIDIQNIYEVDFIVPFENLTDEFIIEVDELKDIWGQGVKESCIAIENINLVVEDIQILGNKSNTIKFEVDGIEFVKFRVDENDKLLNIYNSWETDITNVKLNVVGRCGLNEWDGVKSMQVIIDDYEII